MSDKKRIGKKPAPAPIRIHGSAVEMVPRSELKPYPKNAKAHPVDQLNALEAIIRDSGWTKPILIDSQGEIIAGHGAYMVSGPDRLNMAEVPCVRVSGLTPAQIKGLRISDNALGLRGEWDEGLLLGEITALLGDGFDAALTGFTPEALGGFKVPGFLPEEQEERAEETPPPPAKPRVRLGEVWHLGNHRLLCGSSTEANGKEFLAEADLICTDPPYCSGGFQESDKSSGSVGTSAAHKQIANDRLSTRGYQSLMREAIFSHPAQFFYVFTDWRMWLSLFDVAESSGAGVRSMIVWDKGTPGMGRGWRAQHELVMWATKAMPPFPPKFGGFGNVIRQVRQSNDLHTTQKPVEVMQQLLQGAPFSKIVGDPFAGSGTTLIACEIEGKACRAVELDLAYAEVIITRWEKFTGKTATREDGKRLADLKPAKAKAAA